MNQWHTQAGNITTNLKVEFDFILPALSVMNAVVWKFYVDESAKVRYDMILWRDLLKELVLNFKISDHVIEADDGNFKGLESPMVYLGKY